VRVRIKGEKISCVLSKEGWTDEKIKGVTAKRNRIPDEWANGKKRSGKKKGGPRGKGTPNSRVTVESYSREACIRRNGMSYQEETRTEET